ncbi:MAG: hypothetical protein J3Q66DRAFT_325951 [Benniella sp.]|nr:MAG: hypothetical protein J3Q66DRAFT_325951 [Benniella sp.]
MAQRPFTFRIDEDDQDAPPPYEATATTATTPLTLTTRTPVPPHQLYPVLNEQSNDSASVPPPSIDYYPAMAPSPTSPTTVASFSHYPVMSAPVPPPSSYPVMSPQPQSYPVMPLQAAGGMYPVPFAPPSQGSQFMYHPPSAPLIDLSGTSSASTDAMPPYSPPAVVPDATTFGDVKVRPTSIPPSEQDLIQLNGWSDHGDGTDLSTTIATNAPSPPVPSTSPFSMSAPQPIPVPLVMGYKCGKCGAPLESDTAVCKKLHALSFVETFVQNATKLDLEERRRYNTGAEWTASTSAPPVAGPSSSPYGPYQHHPQQQQQQQQLGNQETRIPHNGSNGHYPGYHPYYTRESEDSTAHSISSSNSIPTVENNHGTDNTYIRRSISVQNPVTTLKKFWRDTKTEIKNQSSRPQRSSVQYEIVAPPPLPSLAGNSGGSSSSSSGSTTMEPRGLNRSNTLTPNPTPAYNPSFVSHK